MAKDPAILFYTSDFLSGTMTMTNEHVGMYIRLLCLQHQKGKLTEKDMLFICGTYLEDVYSKFTKTKNSLYFNERLENEALKRKNYSESRRKNRLMAKSYVRHMENENTNENKAKNKKINEWFEEIWNLYPNKDGKKEAERHFCCSVKTEADFQRIQTALEKYKAHLSKNPWKQPKNGSTWFNNWQDWENREEFFTPKNK